MKYLFGILVLGLTVYLAASQTTNSASATPKSTLGGSGNSSSSSGNSSSSSGNSTSGNSTSGSSSSNSSSGASSSSSGNQPSSGGSQGSSGSQDSNKQLHPDGYDQIQNDPNQPWIGRWESIPGREENFNAFLRALDVPELQQHGQGPDKKVFYQFWKEGDNYHERIQAPQQNIDKVADFKLNEEGSVKVKDVEIKFKFNVEGPKLISTFNAVQKNKLLHMEHNVNGDEMEKVYRIGDVQGKRWFKRISKADLDKHKNQG